VIGDTSDPPFDAAATVTKLLLVLVPMVLAYSVHEFAHAFVATRLGDPTPEEDGRLTLDPRAHIDPVGTLLMPALAVLGGGLPMLGWARPTAFRPDRFTVKLPRRLGDALVSAAGPVSNLLFGFVAAVVLVCVQIAAFRSAGAEPDPRSLGVASSVLFLRLVQMNALLAVFNALPVPPLDGVRLLPSVFDPFFAKHGRIMFPLLFLGIAFVPGVASFLIGRPTAYLEAAMIKSAAALVLPVAERLYPHAMPVI
jgi:Zn-dependent protease